MQNVAKNYIIEIEILNINNSIVDNIEEDIEKRDKRNLDLLTTDLYLYTVVIMHMYWREKDIIDYLKFSVLSH